MLYFHPKKLFEKNSPGVAFLLASLLFSWDNFFALIRGLNMFFILQYIGSARFMASALSNLVNILSEGIYKNKCKYRHDDKKCETCCYI